MSPSQWPTPDSLLTGFLRILGIPSVIVSVVIFASWLGNWVQAAGRTAEGAQATGRFLARVRAMPPVRFAGAVAMTSLILCAQLSAFLPWYLIGQGSSLWWDSARMRAISAAVQGQGYVGALHPSSVARLLPVNAAISGCLAVWSGSVLLSYWLAFAGRDGERVVNVVVTAGNVLLQFAMFAFAMRVVIKLAEPTESQLESGDHRRGAAIAMLVGTLVVMALVGLVFNAMAHLALRGCGAMVRLWAHGDAPRPAVRKLLRGSSPWRGFWWVSRA